MRVGEANKSEAELVSLRKDVGQRIKTCSIKFDGTHIKWHLEGQRES